MALKAYSDIPAICVRGESIMRDYTFQVTMLATISVKGMTRAIADQKLRLALMASERKFGSIDDELVVGVIEIEGDLDLIDAIECPCAE
jgi:hypothetical protein